MFGLEELAPKIKRKSHQEFVDEWKKSMGEAFKVANEKITKAADYNKRNYDKSAHEVEIGIGDRVLMKNVRERGGTGKLRSHWEHSMFEVTEKKPNLPVYTITNINKKKDVRVVHRNLLMKANELPEDMFQQEKRRKQVGKKNVKFGESVQNVAEEDDDDQEEEVVITYQMQGPEDHEEEEEEEIRIDQPEVLAEDILDVTDTEDMVEQDEEEESENEDYQQEEEDELPADESVNNDNSEDDADDDDDQPPVRRSSRKTRAPEKLNL